MAQLQACTMGGGHIVKRGGSTDCRAQQGCSDRDGGEGFRGSQGMGTSPQSSSGSSIAPGS